MKPWWRLARSVGFLGNIEFTPEARLNTAGFEFFEKVKLLRGKSVASVHACQ